MPLARCFNGFAESAPCMHRRIRRQTSFKNFIPTNNLAPLAVEELFGMVDYETLEVFFLRMLLITLDAELLDALLTLGT